MDNSLHMLTNDAMDWLYKNVGENLDAYKDPKADFGRILEENGHEDYREPTGVTVNGDLELKDPAEIDANPKRRHRADIQAFEVYRALDGMTVKLATEPRIWAYLNHFHLHGYGISRWPVGGKNAEEHVRRHWLTSGALRKRVLEVSVSGRMWWIAHVATDAANASGGAFVAKDALGVFSENPEYYHRTMQYVVLRNPRLRAECVRALMNEARGINRDGYREICMELNRAAGARLLDSLDRPDQRSLIQRSAHRLKRNPRYVTRREDMAGVRPYRVLSLGAGAQSTVLALMAEEGWEGLEKPDLAIFADTRWEPPSVYEHLEWLEKQLSYEVVRVSAGDIRENILKGVNPDGSRFLDVPVFLRKKDGTHGVARRQCTTHYKITPIHQEIRRRLDVPSGRRVPKDRQTEMWLGISVDESTRIKPSRDEWITNRYPLVDMGLSRADIYNWFSERYPGRRLPRSACVGCPYHDDMEWKWLKENEHSSFMQAVHVDWAIRSVPEARGSLRDDAYLHKSRRPLSDVDFSSTADYDDYMAGECEGLCGV